MQLRSAIFANITAFAGTALSGGAVQAQMVPMPVDRVRELLPLLQSDVAEVRREALRQLAPTREDHASHYWRHGLVPLDRRLLPLLADALVDKDPEVAAAAAEVLPKVVLAIGAPAVMVARWARQGAPDSDFTREITAALAAADARWPVDALLERVDAERRKDAPALPPELLAHAFTILRTQAKAAKVEGAPVRVRLEVEPARPEPPRTPPEAPMTAIPDALITGLRSRDEGVAIAAFETFERLREGRPLPREMIRPLVDFAMGAPQKWWNRVSSMFWPMPEQDPETLLDWWRFLHARFEAERHDGEPPYYGSVPRHEIQIAIVVLGRWGAPSLPALQTIAREGAVEDRDDLAELLFDYQSPFSKAPLGDELLIELMRKGEVENGAHLLIALKRHPEVVKEVLEQLDPWLERPAPSVKPVAAGSPDWRELVRVLALAGEAAAPLLPHVVARCEQERTPLSDFWTELPRFGAAAGPVVSAAFDAAREPYQRERLARMLLELELRRDDALVCFDTLLATPGVHAICRADALEGFARAAPHDARLLAACRRALVAEDAEHADAVEAAADAELRAHAWTFLARHFGLKVDDEGILRPD